MRRAAPLTLLMVCAGLLGNGEAGAQRTPMAPPHADWRTLETEHFRVHYTVGVERWTEWLAGRLDDLYAGVVQEVGFAPTERLTLIVDDVSVAPGGEVLPFRSGPLLLLDPTPMEPRWTVAAEPWPVVLAAHELSHAVQSSMGPPAPGTLRWLQPFQMGPIPTRAPRWATEGYATLVEGRLTGSNGSSSVFRAAVLRTWGVARRLPSYAGMNYSEEFLGANMAYLVGAAFLEQLAETAGSDALPALWRRLAEADGPGFDQAFQEVFGAPAPMLYEVFRESVNQRARTAYDLVVESGLREGNRLHQFHWRVDGREGGDPALSADGTLLALAVRPAGGEQHIEVWERHALVNPALPPPTVAVLAPEGGRGHESPRFMPDGESLLVARHEPAADGSAVHDLFLWQWRTGELRRVTHGEAVREGDPAPDGRSAVAVRVRGGITDLVRVDLATGAVELLAAGSPERFFARPRWSPDGRQVVVVVQEAGRARVGLLEGAGGALRLVDPEDGVNRYDPVFAEEDRLLLVSEASGIAEVAWLHLPTATETPLTRLTTGAFWPVPTPEGNVLFMALHPEGLDLRSVGAGLVGAGAGAEVGAAPDQAVAPVAKLPAALFPVVPRADSVDAPPAAGPPVEGAPYGWGPRLQDLLPGMLYGADAAAATLTFRNRDLLRRLTWSVDAAFGDGELWRGGSTTVVWRDRDPNFTAHAFVAEQQPSAAGRRGFAAPHLDLLFSGIFLRAARAPRAADSTTVLAAGVSMGHLHADRGDATRATVFTEAGVGRALPVGSGRIVLSARARVEGGWTGGTGWSRLTTHLLMDAGGPSTGRLRAMFEGGRLQGEADLFEHFVVGGPAGPLLHPDVLGQRQAMPALEFGALGGREMVTGRVDYTLLRLPTIYVWAGQGSYPLDRRTWMAGAEKTFFAEDPRLGWILPGLSALVGVGMEIEGPRRVLRSVHGYLSVSYRP